MLQEIIDSYPDEKILIADGFDDAIIGIEIPSMRLIYSVKKMYRDINGRRHG